MMALESFFSLLIPQADSGVDQGCFDRMIADREQRYYQRSHAGSNEDIPGDFDTVSIGAEHVIGDIIGYRKCDQAREKDQ